jgi:hypothetical protein
LHVSRVFWVAKLVVEGMQVSLMVAGAAAEIADAVAIGG